MPKAIGTLGFNETVTVAGRTLPTEGLVILTTYHGASPDVVSAMSGDGGLTAYEVPTGKTLKIKAIRTVNSTAAASSMGIGSGTAACLIQGQAGYPTGDINFPYIAAVPAGSGVGAIGEQLLEASIGQNRFPYAVASAGQAFGTFFGYLE